MPELINIQKVVIGPKNMLATLSFAPSGPVMTNANPQAAERVKWLVPEIMRHACTGDAGKNFGISISRTEIAHLVEHVTLELMAQSGNSTPIFSGRTRRVADHLYEVEIAAPDDVLATSALSSAVFIVNWAFQAKDNKNSPNVEAIISGIRNVLANAEKIEADLKAQKEADEIVACAKAKEEAAKEEEPEAATRVQKGENKPSETGALNTGRKDAPSAVSEAKPRSQNTSSTETGQFEVLSPSENTNEDALNAYAQEAAKALEEKPSEIAPEPSEEASTSAPFSKAPSDKKEEEKTANEPGQIHLGTTVGFMSPRDPHKDEDF